jgi:hypothetical protein
MAGPKGATSQLIIISVPFYHYYSNLLANVISIIILIKYNFW